MGYFTFKLLPPTPQTRIALEKGHLEYSGFLVALKKISDYFLGLGEQMSILLSIKNLSNFF